MKPNSDKLDMCITLDADTYKYGILIQLDTKSKKEAQQLLNKVKLSLQSVIVVNSIRSELSKFKRRNKKKKNKV